MWKEKRKICEGKNLKECMEREMKEMCRKKLEVKNVRK